MLGYEWLARSLKASGQTHFFFVDAVLRRTLLELERVGVQPVLAHTEKAAVYMADAYGRVSGRPGVVAAQSVGTANLAAGLQDAWLGRSPVLALTGHKPIGHQHRNAYQEVAHAPLFAPVTKHAAQVHEAADLPRQFRQAWAAAVAAPPRPVHLDLNGLMGEFVETSETSAPPAALGAWTAPRHRPGAEPDAVRAAAAALLSSQRVVIVAGDGAALSGCGAEVLALARCVAGADRHLARRARHGLDAASAACRRGRQLLRAAGQPGGACGGAGPVHRLRYRRPGDTYLAGAEAWHPRRADRCRPAGIRAQLRDGSRAAGRPACGGGGAADGAWRAQAGWRVPGRGAGHPCRVAHGIRAAPDQRRGCHRPGAALRRDLPRAAGGRHPRRRYRLFRASGPARWSTWNRRRPTCARRARWAGPSRPRWVRNALRRIARSSAGRAMVPSITICRSWRRRSAAASR